MNPSYLRWALDEHPAFHKKAWALNYDVITLGWRAFYKSWATLTISHLNSYKTVLTHRFWEL